MNWNHVAIFAAGVVTGEIAILWVVGMCRCAHDLPARPATEDDAQSAPGQRAEKSASLDGLPLSEYMRPKKRFVCVECGKEQLHHINPTTCGCGCGIFRMTTGPLSGAIVDPDRSASAIISPASAVISGPDSRDTSDKRTPRVS